MIQRKNQTKAYVVESDIRVVQKRASCESSNGGISSIRVMSIEEATRLGFLNELPTKQAIFYEDSEDSGVQSIEVVPDPIPGFEFKAYNHSVNFIIPKPWM